MATTIQIVVAGGLLLAWIWVLGRPLTTGSTPESDYRRLDTEPTVDPDYDPSFWGSVGTIRPRWVERVVAWVDRPTTQWRRQLMLATMLAALVAFFLAIAFRGRPPFLALFLLMMTVLAVHVAIATVIGNRILGAQRAVVVATEMRKVQPTGMTIRADKVATQVTEPESVFDAAAALASELKDGAPLDQAAMVSDLIDEAWKEPEPEPAPAHVPEASPEPTEADPAAGATPAPKPKKKRKKKAKTSSGPRLFRRPGSAGKAKSAQSARPIYIESQLDEEAAIPRAVNDQ
ncbi:MAG: hypothetical protein AAF467_26235 [Actinomycetota bacterium]